MSAQHQVEPVHQQQQVSAEEGKKDRDINSIGLVVRHLPVSNGYCYGVALTGGRLYLSSSSYHVVQVMDAATGVRVTRWGTFCQQGKAVIGQPAQFHRPNSLAVDEGRGVLYVADCYNHCVVAVRLCDGVVEAVWGSEGSGQQEFQQPCGLAYCPATDQLYVADSNNHCVKVLRGSDGQCVQVLGTGQGNGSHQMCYPNDVAVDLDHIYIADFCNHRVMVYNKQTGEFLFQMGQGQGRGDTQFDGACGVSVDSEAGVVYVSDCRNHRVCVYRSCDGSYVRHFQVLAADNTKAEPNVVRWNTAAGVLYVTMPCSTTLCVYQG